MSVRLVRQTGIAVTLLLVACSLALAAPDRPAGESEYSFESGPDCAMEHTEVSIAQSGTFASAMAWTLDAAPDARRGRPILTAHAAPAASR